MSKKYKHKETGKIVEALPIFLPEQGKDGFLFKIIDVTPSFNPQQTPDFISDETITTDEFVNNYEEI